MNGPTKGKEVREKKTYIYIYIYHSIKLMLSDFALLWKMQQNIYNKEKVENNDTDL